MPSVHADIPPIRAFLRREYLYDMDPQHCGVLDPCVIYAVSSYKGHWPTFKVLLTETGALFDYLPPAAFTTKADGAAPEDPFLSNKDLCAGIACPDENVTVSVHSVLASTSSPWIWFKERALWVLAEKYVCSIDWYLDNLNVHLLVTKSGHLALIPNHKLVWTYKKPTTLPTYKKLHRDWKPNND